MPLDCLWKGRPVKQLTKGIDRISGRNAKGTIIVYNRGGGLKRCIRLVDFKRSLWNVNACVRRIEKDPNRTCFILLVCYDNGLLSYVISYYGALPLDNIQTGLLCSTSIGNSRPLVCLAPGLQIFNLDDSVVGHANMLRSAGAFGAVLIHNRLKHLVHVRLKNKVLRSISEKRLACIGRAANINHHLNIVGNAGKTRRAGRRPIVRGVAKNPVDHPHGGLTSGGRPSVSRWGWLTKVKRKKY